MTKPKSVEEIVEEFWGKFAWCDLQNSEDNKRMNDWLTQTLTAERQRCEENDAWRQGKRCKVCGGEKNTGGIWKTKDTHYCDA